MNCIKIVRTYPLTILTVALIWSLCFFTPPSTKLDHVIGIDKVVHFGMYAFLTAMLLLERNHGIREIRNYGIGGFRHINDQDTVTFKYIILTLLSPILMSGLIEILQENCTGGRRSGDIWDFAANSLGAISAWLLWRYWVSRKNN